MIYDHDARLRALSPSHSFIVQAPAGSGKTELLTQRFLKLLAIVSEPEEILAVTFTRKAAGEMRHRIIQALLNASEDNALAQAVVARNQSLGWRLIENPNRLKIMTIDALCSTIAHQMPLLSQSGGKFEIASDPKTYYLEAVEKCLLLTEVNDDWSEALKVVLLHFDNRVEKLKTVLSLLLAKREQWLLHLRQIQKNPEELALYFHEVIDSIVSEQLEKINCAFSNEEQRELFELIRYAANNCVDNDINHPIQHWAQMEHFPEASSTQLNAYLALSDFLLTKENQWRKQFIKTTGFLSPSTTKDKEEKNVRKQQIENMLSLMESFFENDELREYLAELRVLPPATLNQDQLSILTALGTLLPVLVGFLKIIFKETGKVDFTEVTLSALHALGDDLPSEIVLRLDYQIQHILIDEYQDTSIVQYKIFEKMVSGWQRDDGRTLFLVGDPMQSIYRFRGAEVNLFLHTQKQGLGDVMLEPLSLKMNFRSNQSVVNWINVNFCKIFPTQVNHTLSAIQYSEAIAAQSGEHNDSVMLHSVTEELSQEDYITDLIEKLISLPETGQLAVLVRARTHLTALIPVLKRRGISFVAHEIEHLAQRPHIIDLLTLLRATADLTDKVAWLALLRSPLVGLTLADLLALQHHVETDIIWNGLEHFQHPRLTPFVNTLRYWLDNRERSTLSHWLKGLWTMLGGFQCYSDPHLAKDFETIFYWVNEYDQGGVIRDIDGFEEKIDELYADVIPSVQADKKAIEIMTIHKAKGLEFDTVILPHCQASTRRNEPSLLLWQELTHANGMDLLFGAYRSSKSGSDKLYDYINHLHKQKERYEAARLFYVAVSRAKKALHLVASPKTALKGSFWSMLMKEEKEERGQTPLKKGPDPFLLLKRLALGWTLPVDYQTRLNEERARVFEPNLPEWTDPVFRLIGTVFHRAMHAELYRKPRVMWENIICLALKRAGVPAISLENAISLVVYALEQLMADPKGQWIIDSRHQMRRAEWAISMCLPKGIEHLVIDYAFVDENNIRWIVDYKLVQTQAFSKEAESEQYRAQLYRYAQALKKYESRPVQAGLYFPLQQEWVVLVK